MSFLKVYSDLENIKDIKGRSRRKECPKGRGLKIKKYIVLCLIISLMVMPIAEARQDDEVPAAYKGAIIAVCVFVVIYYGYNLVRYGEFIHRSDAEKAQRRQRDIYYHNLYQVLFWAKEGMDESAFRNKIGDSIANRISQSTYSSMGSTVHTYRISGAIPSDGGQYSITVWLTFIDGKLFSISTFK